MKLTLVQLDHLDGLRGGDEEILVSGWALGLKRGRRRKKERRSNSRQIVVETFGCGRTVFGEWSWSHVIFPALFFCFPLLASLERSKLQRLPKGT